MAMESCAGRFLMNKKYSVLMSVYKNDNPAYLEEAIESMLNQTIPPEQYVIVVDGPVPEEVGSVIDAYRKNKKLFTVLELGQNGGLANALNHGLAVCRNELVARMDADDISLPKRCEKELEYFAANPELVICGCNINEFYETPDNVRTSRIVPSTYEEIKKFMRRRQAFNHPTVMYKKSKVMECGGYSNLRRRQDFDLFSRMIQKGFYVLNLNESLYLYRVNETSYARRKSKENLKYTLYAYKQHFNRKGCSLVDYTLMSCGEIILYILPVRIMKVLFNGLLRESKD